MGFGGSEGGLTYSKGAQAGLEPATSAAVMRRFEGHIRKGRLATMIECKQCKTAEHPTLADSSVQNIRDFVRNRGVTGEKKGKFLNSYQ